MHGEYRDNATADRVADDIGISGPETAHHLSLGSRHDSSIYVTSTSAE
ncbi:hypothetical protein Natpe_1127 [Natrinema pellirubrum DSM 15624]|uniref:Uncharacterized protein n=1 Tax=Natrinema pellirubrum (strain DSM 15624 / CIP 106293 / JCM 10476 / NCIMB 786 / 157) TaxID=797303 RepID=L0JIA2_NATP1|nr:hypothetical protein Natpe_1127 [Natrinema pellirubrum DSM 15624]